MNNEQLHCNTKGANVSDTETKHEDLHVRRPAICNHSLIQHGYSVLLPLSYGDGDLSERRSRLYFFTPLSTQWPLQGGTFIVERKTSRHCLELWRREIEEMTRTGRGRDQDALREIYQRIQSGEETKCELVRMENENHLSLPMAKTIYQINTANYPSLIHISSGVFAKQIDTEAQTLLVQDVLQLSPMERDSDKYGKIVIHFSAKSNATNSE